MRAEAANIFHYSYLANATAMIRSHWIKELPILGYHRVMDIADRARYPFDLELISATVDDFAWQMEYLSRRFTPITFATLFAAIDGGQPLPKRPVIVTFDDGFSDNYEQVFPILKRFDVPATFFIATGYVGAQQTFWYDWLVYILNRVPAGTLALPEVAPLQLGATIADRRHALHALLDEIKLLTNSQRLRICEFVEQRFGEFYVGGDLTYSRTMTWDNIEEMARAGIEFGSHTVTHPILTGLSDGDLTRELVDSKRDLEAHIERPVQTISYPVGQAFAFDARVRDAAMAAGYRAGISTLRGVNKLSLTEPFALRRLAIETQVSRAEFAAKLALPEVFAA